MLCPSCGQANVPGADECARCLFPLASIDNEPAGIDAVESAVLQDPVRTLKFKPPVTVPADAKLGLALHKMVDNAVGALLVVDDVGRLVGILTERDYLRKVVGVLPDYAHQPIKDVMTPKPETVRPEDKLGLAMQMMDVGSWRKMGCRLDWCRCAT
jgi:signal-transduction protein with cAMP-binding, CBS, and nucleotidyltransferase domain